MATRIVSLVIDCADPERLAEFWSRVLGGEVSARGWQRTPAGPSGATVTVSGPRGLEIDFRWVPDRSGAEKNGLHLDINPTDRNQADELERLLALGARPVDVGQRNVSWHVLADPEGNVFCLCRDRVDP